MKKPRQLVLRIALCLLATLLFSSVAEAQSSQEAPAYKITPEVSKIQFNVKAPIAIEENFEEWNATLAFASTGASTGLRDGGHTQPECNPNNHRTNADSRAAKLRPLRKRSALFIGTKEPSA